jgi:hypothetical protein
MEQGHEHEGAHCRTVHFFLNRQRKESLDHTLTGHQLKVLAGVPDADELFLETDCGDDLVPTDATVLVRDGDRFHTMPSPQYGDGFAPAVAEQIDEVVATYKGEVRGQAAHGLEIILRDVSLPAGYSVTKVNILIKVPPTFPDARPDMFWVNPPIVLANGAQPQATSIESMGSESWQRYSWHLQPQAWHAGTSRLRDFVRAVLARLYKVG